MKSGIYFPNKFARLTLQAMEEVIGAGGMKAIYNIANLPELAAGLPADDMQSQIDFEDISQLFATLSTLFGNQGARSLSIRAGRVTMQQGIQVYRSALTTESLELPTGIVSMEKQLVRLNRFSNFLNSVWNQKTSVVRCTEPDGFEFSVERCPFCWNRQDNKPICAFFEGMLEEAIKVFSDKQPYSVSEVRCIASGSESCQYFLRRLPDSANADNDQEQN